LKWILYFVTVPYASGYDWTGKLTIKARNDWL